VPAYLDAELGASLDATKRDHVARVTRIVMTLLVRDEADALEEHLAFHLNAGVDYVIATDHRSSDGTTEILESYARDGQLRLLREEATSIRQSEWVTRMARLAASEHGADWVINSDADEFWWPRGESLRTVLDAVPAEVGVVRSFAQSFVPRRGDGWFVERMTVRIASRAAINDPATSFRPVAKVAHRAHPEIVVGQGNHHISSPPLRALAGWHPIELLHFPLRSPDQVVRKHRNALEAWEGNLRGDLARARSDAGQDAAGAFYERLVLSDPAVEAGLAAGVLVRDTRLRDVLRSLRSGKRGFRRSPGRDVLRFDKPSPAGNAEYATEVLTLADADLVRLARRLDQLAARLVLLEGGRRRK
jgi:hypothetical protein